MTSATPCDAVHDRVRRGRRTMSKPNLSVVVEPSDGSSLFYEPVAAKDTKSKPSGIDLPVAQHHEQGDHDHPPEQGHGSPWPGPPAVATATIPVPIELVAAGRVRREHRARAGMASWNFLREGGENDTVVLPDPGAGICDDQPLSSSTVSARRGRSSSSLRRTKTRSRRKRLSLPGAIRRPARRRVLGRSEQHARHGLGR